MVTVRPGTRDDRAAIEDLLASADLPRDGLGVPLTDFVVAISGDRIVGAGAIEHHGPDALLRSLVVDPSVRSRGIGSALVAALERVAAEAGLGGPYLLTTSAESFFSRRGYRRIPRDGAPAPVRASLEWATVCGDTAVALVRD